jgi:hypothetical protein
VHDASRPLPRLAGLAAEPLDERRDLGEVDLPLDGPVLPGLGGHAVDHAAGLVLADGARAHTGRLGGAATAGENAFAAAAEHAAAITDLARQVGDAAPAACDTTCRLDWLHALYTMEEERVVHRETLGLPAPVEASVADDEELDDFVL